MKEGVRDKLSHSGIDYSDVGELDSAFDLPDPFKGLDTIYLLDTSKNTDILRLHLSQLPMDSVQQACQQLPVRNQPRIAAIVGKGSTQYFVICESKVLCEVPTLQAVLFTAFSAYYCFNLEYPASAKNIFCFFQDYILGHPDSNKKSGTYLATVSDIKRNL